MDFPSTSFEWRQCDWNREGWLRKGRDEREGGEVKQDANVSKEEAMKRCTRKDVVNGRRRILTMTAKGMHKINDVAGLSP